MGPGGVEKIFFDILSEELVVTSSKTQRRKDETRIIKN
jgi:hypothetical protein